LVFAMGGVEGILSQPPNGVNDASKLIETMRIEDRYEGQHMSQIDVTGGIGLKVERGFQTVAHGVEVHLVSGEIEARVRDACLGHEVRGTILVP